MPTPSRPGMVTAGRSPELRGVVVTVEVVAEGVVELTVVLVVVVGSNWGRMGKGYEGSLFLEGNHQKEVHVKIHPTL